MELPTIRELRRNEQQRKVMSKKADTPESAAKAQAQTAPRQTADRCTLSRQALACLDQQNMLMRELEERRARQQSKLAGYQNKKNELDLLSKELKVMDKCLKIAASIMKGNRVPPEDLEYLRQNDPDGYKLALALRRDNPDPKDEKSVLDDEDRNGPSAEESGGGEPVSTAGPVSSGGDVSTAPE